MYSCSCRTSTWWLALLVFACQEKAAPSEQAPDKGQSVPSASSPNGTPSSTTPLPPLDATPRVDAAIENDGQSWRTLPLDPTLRQRSVAEQQSYLLQLLAEAEGLSEGARTKVSAILRGSAWLSFGNPKISAPASTQESCLAEWSGRTPAPADPSCGHPRMVRAAPGSICVDQYEFPNVLCEYPIVWVRSSEAAELCKALGKRLCDAHEWEGACAGAVRAPEDEYSYSKLPLGSGAEYRRARRLLMEGWHNSNRKLVWAYGAHKDHLRCGTGAKKSASCTTVDWGICGTNDYPSGAFPTCRTPSGIYDQHGNVAEHMSLPLYPDELGGRGYTEMKGSWFLFQREETHPDDCHWRARNWHTTKISDGNSHRNYHLGFRCCSDASE